MDTDPQVIALAALLLSGALFISSYFLTVAVRGIRSVRREAIRFRFFQARDRLYLLAADGEISGDGKHLSALRDSINRVIRESDALAAEEFFNIANSVSKDGKKSTWRAGLSARADAEMMSIIGDVASAMLDMIRYNSRLVRVLFAFSARDQVRKEVAMVQQLQEIQRITGKR